MSLDTTSSNDTDPRDAISFHIASRLWEREAAFRLIYRAYLAADLSAPNPHEMRVTKYHLQPDCPIFVARKHENIEATVSMVFDGPLGLPIDTLYPEQMEILRNFNVKCAEMCCLADRSSNLAKGIDSLIGMTRLALHYAIKRDVACLVLLAHPRHAKFYKRAMGFKAIDKVRACPYVRGFPAEPLLLDLVEVRTTKPRLYSRYFEEGVPADHLEYDPIAPEEIEYFSRYLDEESSKSREAA